MMEEDVTVHKDRVLVQEISHSAFSAVQPKSVLSDGIYAFTKRAFDVSCALIGIVLCAIPMLVIAVRIRVTSPGKVIFRQKRVGKNGKLFTIYKFRTMVDGAENFRRHLSPKQYAQYIKERKLTDDPRVTPFGGFLRRSSLDELPHLLNILKGDMSLVGPRPVVMDELKHYKEDVYAYLGVRPGLTGMWQVNGRSATTYAERVRLDVRYFEKHSFGGDVHLVAQTFAVVFRKNGAY
ncbi:MAG: sugar transferase [Ethanoligenens sp.]